MTKELSREELRNMYRNEYVSKHANPPVRRIHTILRYVELDRSDVVVDYACGDGILAQSIFDQVAQYVGVDFSDELLRYAVERMRGVISNNIDFQCEDIVPFCHNNNDRFDKAFALDFSEHIYDDDFVMIFSAIRSSLKAGGKLYLHTPNAEYFLEKFKALGIIRQFPEHIAVRTDKELVRLLKIAGFGEIHLMYLPHYNVLRYLRCFSSIPVIGRFFRARLLLECRK